MPEELVTIWKVPIFGCAVKERFICICLSCKRLESVNQNKAMVITLCNRPHHTVADLHQFLILLCKCIEVSKTNLRDI